MNIHELLGYGPVVAGAEDLGVLVTVNGAYLNLWAGDGERFENTDCRHLPSRTGGRDLREVPVGEAMDLAAAWIHELAEEAC